MSLEDEQGWQGDPCGSGLRAHTQRGRHLLLQVSGQGWALCCFRSPDPANGVPAQGDVDGEASAVVFEALG